MKKWMVLPLVYSMMLVGCGGGGSSSTPITPVTPVTQASPFQTTGGLVTPRTGHASVLLPDGRVVVFGGRRAGGGAVLATAEIFTPTLGTWAQVASPMTTARLQPSAAVLGDGTILIAGGSGLASAEIFNPATGVFTTSGSMALPRGMGFSLVALEDGSALAAGLDSGGSAVVEIYSSATKKFKVVGSLGGGEFTINDLLYNAVDLGNGSVLLYGDNQQYSGQTQTDKSETFVYNIAAQTFKPGPAPTIQRFGASIASLGSGKAVLIGGLTPVSAGSSALNNAELIDTVLSLATPTGLMVAGRSGFTATTLATGKVLVAGGSTTAGALASAELLDPATLTFQSAGSMVTPRVSHVATLLANGEVLITGSDIATASPIGNPLLVPSAELYHP